MKACAFITFFLDHYEKMVILGYQYTSRFSCVRENRQQHTFAPKKQTDAHTQSNAASGTLGLSIDYGRRAGSRDFLNPSSSPVQARSVFFRFNVEACLNIRGGGVVTVVVLLRHGFQFKNVFPDERCDLLVTLHFFLRRSCCPW